MSSIKNTAIDTAESHGPAAVIVFTGALVSQLWAPKTKGMSLSETAHLFSH